MAADGRTSIKRERGEPARLRDAGLVRLEAPVRPIDAFEAKRFGLRLRGLAGLAPARIAPLLIPRCASIHTFGMRVPIDVVWLDVVTGRGHVLAVSAGVPPRRVSAAPRRRRGAIAALELPDGAAAELGIEAGVVISLSPLGAAAAQE